MLVNPGAVKVAVVHEDIGVVVDAAVVATAPLPVVPAVPAGIPAVVATVVVAGIVAVAIPGGSHRRPTDIAVADGEVHMVRPPGVAGHPGPAIVVNIGPVPVVVRDPAPGLVGDPGPAVGRVGPVAVGVRSPAVFHVGNPDVHPQLGSVLPVAIIVQRVVKTERGGAVSTTIPGLMAVVRIVIVVSDGEVESAGTDGKPETGVRLGGCRDQGQDDPGEQQHPHHPSSCISGSHFPSSLVARPAAGLSNWPFACDARARGLYAIVLYRSGDAHLTREQLPCQPETTKTIKSLKSLIFKYVTLEYSKEKIRKNSGDEPVSSSIEDRWRASPEQARPIHSTLIPMASRRSSMPLTWVEFQ